MTDPVEDEKTRHHAFTLRHLILKNAPISALDLHLSSGARNSIPFLSDDRAETPLHHACRMKRMDVVEKLMEYGCPWTALNQDGKTCAEVARESGWEEGYVRVLDEAVRSELLMAALADFEDDDEDDEDVDFDLDQGDAVNDTEQEQCVDDNAEEEGDATEYLERTVEYQEERLLDDQNEAVMMEWERDIMKHQAQQLVSAAFSALSETDHRTTDITMVNVGFGMGIVDGYLRQFALSNLASTENVYVRHYILEAHPSVFAHLESIGFNHHTEALPNGNRYECIPLLGRWQDTASSVPYQLDAVYFDTFGEDYKLAMRQFHRLLSAQLSERGVYAFFNGLAGTNVFFHHVACEVIECEVNALYMEVAWEEIPSKVPDEDDEAWKGVKRRYFSLPTYRAPLIRRQPKRKQ